MYINCEINFFAPPPFLIHIFSPEDIYYNEVVRLFCYFVNFKFTPPPLSGLTT